VLVYQRRCACCCTYEGFTTLNGHCLFGLIGRMLLYICYMSVAACKSKDTALLTCR
jgi:hypothetical protein